MPVKLRRIVSELMIYDAKDQLSTKEAETLKAKNIYGPWTVDTVGVTNIKEFNNALKDFINIKQLSICSHGAPGRVPFGGDVIIEQNLHLIKVPSTLFDGPGKLLFMGCETAGTEDGEKFLIAAGRHFFAGKGGMVGGANVSTLGFSSGTRLPLLGPSPKGWRIGKLIIFQLDAKGNLIKSKTAKPFGL